ncbi:MAG: DUF58 domain-containing protein [Candidatus Eisenbacteria sp.]|nr:DUF58 domain-containing protein [Candidatus Eisenbacteria bacterium]
MPWRWFRTPAHRPPREAPREAPPQARPAGSASRSGGGVGEVLSGEILRQVRRLEIRTRAVVTELFAGQYHSVFKGQGMEFAEVREYVPGDDIRLIDWNVTARCGTPYIKKYVEERELTVFLAVDLSGSQGFGSAGRSKVELAAEVAALIAFSAINNQDKVGLLTFTDRPELLIPPRKGRSHGLRLIREILYGRPEGRGTDLAAACETALHALRRRSVLFLLSDFQVPLAGLEPALGVLARKHDLIALEVRDPAEEGVRRAAPGSPGTSSGEAASGWPAIGLVAWEDPETGRRMLFDTSDPSARRGLQSRFADLRGEFHALLKRQRIDRVTLRVGEDPVEPLLAFFKLRERRLARE